MPALLDPTPDVPPRYVRPVPDAERYVRAGDVTLRCEIHGAAHLEAGARPPLVLVSGLGSDTILWFRQIPAWSADRCVVAFDNRGAGRSDKPEGPYAIAQLADDTAALLDALGLVRADVLGASMGGYVAQAFALRHPHRLRRLVLACTAFGGAQSVAPAPEVLDALVAREADPAASLRRSYDVFAGAPWRQAHADLIEWLVAHRVRHPVPAHAFLSQVQAAAAFDAADAVHRIAAPTLILHGTDDRVVPVENAYRLAERIPDTSLCLVPGTGHIFFIEAADLVNAAVTAFLEE